jgi:hypothetical protein
MNVNVSVGSRTDQTRAYDERLKSGVKQTKLTENRHPDSDVAFRGMSRRSCRPLGTAEISRGCSLTRGSMSSSPWCACRVHCSLRSRLAGLRIMALEDVGGPMCKTRLGR